MKRVFLTFVVLCLAVAESAAQPEGFAYGLEHSYIGPITKDFWRMNLETGEVQTIGHVNSAVLASPGMIDSWNNVFVYYSDGDRNGEYEMVGLDLLTGEERYRSEIVGGVPTGTCFNPVNGLFYCLLLPQGGGSQLVAINIAEGVVQYFEELEIASSQACSGMLDYKRGRYHYAIEEDRVYELDIYSGKILDDYSLDLQLWPGFLDPVSGKFYGMGGRGKEQFVTFDPDTREMDVIKDELDFMYRDVCVGGIDIDRRLFAMQFGDGDLGIFDFDGNRLRTVSFPSTSVKFQWTVYPPDVAGAGELARVSGQVRSDRDSDCITDVSDDPMSGWIVNVKPINRSLRTNRDGRFTAYLPAGNYTFTAEETELWQSPCMRDGMNVTLGESLGDVDNVNIPLEAQSLFEAVDVSVTSTPSVVGRALVYYIRVQNRGTAAYSGRLRFRHDPVLSDFTSIPQVFNYDAPEAEWRIEDLAIGATDIYVVTLTVPRDETLMDLVVCGAVELPDRSSSELAVERSTDQVCTVISAPLDPNDISVSPRGVGSRGIVSVEDNTLAYTIRFQNVGSSPAQDVVIRDTLDADLDVNTIYFGAASHDYQVDVVNNNILEFRFEGIDLPGVETDEAGSHGVVKYTVDFSKELPVDTEIFNRAAIYFDFNKPVITNTVVNTIGQSPTDIAEPSDSDELELRSLGNGLFICRAENGLEGRLSVYSILGTKVLEQSLAGQSHTVINLANQSTGRFLIRLEKAGKSIIRSVVVLH